MGISYAQVEFSSNMGHLAARKQVSQMRRESLRLLTVGTSMSSICPVSGLRLFSLLKSNPMSGIIFFWSGFLGVAVGTLFRIGSITPPTSSSSFSVKLSYGEFIDVVTPVPFFALIDSTNCDQDHRESLRSSLGSSFNIFSTSKPAASMTNLSLRLACSFCSFE